MLRPNILIILSILLKKRLETSGQAFFSNEGS